MSGRVKGPTKFSVGRLFRKVHVRYSSRLITSGPSTITTTAPHHDSPILFLGANGFSASCYRPVFEHLRSILPQKTSIIPVEYHNLLIRNETTDWHPLVDSIIEKAEKIKSGNNNLTAVGHSAGGALICCAASKRPELFSNVVIIDSPMFNPYRRFLWSLIYTSVPTPAIEKFHPLIKGALRKKESWDTMEDAKEYFASSRFFQKFEPRMLDSFLEHNLRSSDCGKIKLVFSPESEAQMYLTTPTETPLIGVNGTLGQYGAVDQKGSFLYSLKFEFLERSDVTFLESHFRGLNFHSFDHGHFWPMEDPISFATRVAELVEDCR